MGKINKILNLQAILDEVYSLCEDCQCRREGCNCLVISLLDEIGE